MKIEFDQGKSDRNGRERGLPFEKAADLDWDKAFTTPDLRHDYGEQRYLTFAPLKGRLHVVCFSLRGDVRRIISFRKANKREERFYEKATADR